MSRVLDWSRSVKRAILRNTGRSALLAQELTVLDSATRADDLVAIKAFLQQHVHGHLPSEMPGIWHRRGRSRGRAWDAGKFTH